MLLLLIRALDDDGKLPGIDIDDITRGAKIRCPRCRYPPRASDRWGCDCGHVWNTFDTRGKCPACKRQWHDTQCLACHKWSRHEDWYARSPE
ncbi:Hypothetical protein A7982_07658 [Minicystis rosea]|nr:Hypothetical protein A7982_07658 [Minicystis rosea]